MTRDESFVPTRLTLISILFASTLMLLGGAAVAPALDLIRDRFATGDLVMTLVVTLPSLGVAVTGFITGAVADRVGKVKVLLVSLLVFGIAGVGSFFATDVTVLLAERFVVGIGIGGITGCCTALVSEYYNGDARVKVLSYQTAAMGLGVLILETGGGLLAGMGWNGPFLIYAIAFPILACCLLSVREPGARRFDGPSVEIVYDRTTTVVCYVAIFVNNMVMFAIPAMLSTYIAEVQGVNDSLVTGLLLGFNGVINALTCLSFRRIASKVPFRYILSLAWAVMGVGYLLFLLPGSIPQILVSTCLAGVGIGLGTTVIVTLLSSRTPPEKSGKIMGGYSMFLNLGQFVSTFVIAALVAVVGSRSGMFVSYGVIILVAAAVMVPVMTRVIRD